MKRSIFIALLGLFLLPLPTLAQANPFRLGLEIAKQRKVLLPDMGSEFFRNLSNAVADIESGATVELAAQRHRVNPKVIYRLLDYTRPLPTPQTLPMPTVETKATTKPLQRNKKYAKNRAKSIVGLSTKKPKDVSVIKQIHKHNRPSAILSSVAHSTLSVELEGNVQENFLKSDDRFSIIPERFLKPVKMKPIGLKQYQMLYLWLTEEPEINRF
jgi:hypothetical protein